VNGDDLLTSADPDTIKACCAAVYQHDLVALVLGESYHPGGVELTRHLARTLGLRPGQRVLDVASGPGTTALLLAEEFGVQVHGVDLGETSVARARALTAERGLDDRVRFHVGDAEQIPFDDATFDAVICECAFCTFPAKPVAAAEFARVLRCGGRLGLTDVTLDLARLDPQLVTLAGYVACLADARPAAEYETLLAAAGLSTLVSEAHDETLAALVAQIEARVRALSILNLPGVTFDLDTVIGYLAAAHDAVTNGVAGYRLLVAEKRSRP
jgi:arsenite methyltransferase